MASFALALLAFMGHVAAVDPIAAVLLQLRVEALPAEESRNVGSPELLAEESTDIGSPELPAEEESTDTGSSAASHATISEWGYERVAALKSNHEMELFVRRNLDEADLMVVEGHEDDLNRLIPRYSGEIATQSLEALHKEFSAADWVTYKRTESHSDQDVAKEREAMTLDDRLAKINDTAEIEVSPGANASANFLALKDCRSIKQGNFLQEAEHARVIVAEELHNMPEGQRREFLVTLRAEAPHIVLQNFKGAVRHFTLEQMEHMIDHGTFHLLAERSEEETSNIAEKEEKYEERNENKKASRLAKLTKHAHEEVKEKHKQKQTVAHEEQGLKQLTSQINSMGKERKQAPVKQKEKVRPNKRIIHKADHHEQKQAGAKMMKLSAELNALDKEAKGTRRKATELTHERRQRRAKVNQN